MEEAISFLKRHPTRILVLSFLATLLLLILQTVLNMKDINDTWILEGILPLFVFFTILYVAIARAHLTSMSSRLSVRGEWSL
jgi:hypothetical protein